jgi:hypothetical protein
VSEELNKKENKLKQLRFKGSFFKETAVLPRTITKLLGMFAKLFAKDFT